MQYSASTYQPRLSVLSRCLIAAACCSVLGACGGGGGASSEPEKPLSAELPSMTTAAATAASGADSAASAASMPAATAQAAAAIEPVAGVAVADTAATAASSAASDAAATTSKIAATATKVDAAAAVIATSATKTASPAPAPTAVAVAPAAQAIKAGSPAATAPVQAPSAAPAPAPAPAVAAATPAKAAPVPAPTLPATLPVNIAVNLPSVAAPAPTSPVTSTDAGSTANAAAAAAPAPSAVALAPKSILGTAAAMAGLSYASPEPTATTTGVGAVALCNRGYTAPAGLTAIAALAIPTSGGVFYTPAELAVWRQRASSNTGPFIAANDFTKGSPGDLSRILTNATKLASAGEVPLTSTTAEATFGSHGTLARDAAFAYLLLGDAGMQTAVRKYLLAQAANPVLDFAKTLCITDTSGNTNDGKFFHASWLLRYVVTYDYVRHSLPAADRLTIENFIRRNAYFFAAHADWGLSTVFPNRMLGDYSKRSSSAATTTEASTWQAKRYDTNGDCLVNASDAPTASPIYAYVSADGKVGPRISVLSQWYNNRRSTLATAFGAAGVLLGDATLITSAKRYFMEWLAYGVWGDGAQGEYARNGDYCIAAQGPIYSANNSQGAAMLAQVLVRKGDRSLIDFSTTAGLFGTESSTPKTIELTVKTYLDLMTGKLKWFYHEPWRSQQVLTSAGSLGNTEVRYMAGTQVMDDYHELGLLPAAALMPRLNIAGVVMRDKTITPLRFPGSTGNPVPTGYGNWNDTFNALPAVLLLRP
jgi:hypothetical protein